MSAFLDWLIEWNTVLSLALLGFIVVGALLTGLTTIGGIASNLRENKKVLALQKEVSDAKAAQQRVGIDLAEAKRKQAEAEEAMMRMRLPRWITDESVEILKTGSKGVVDILYLANNREAFLLSGLTKIALEQGGWRVASIAATDVERVPPLGVRLEVGRAVYINPPSADLSEPANTLWQFFNANLQSAGMGGLQMNKELDDNALVIVIGPKTM